MALKLLPLIFAIIAGTTAAESILLLLRQFEYIYKEIWLDH